MLIKKIISTLTLVTTIYTVYYLIKPKKVSPFETYAALIPDSYRLGFTNLDKEISVNRLPITGDFPKWLSGTLFRNGPAKFSTDKSWVSNWFDGLAMIHAFTFDNGQVSYANKFLITDDYSYVQKTGLMNYAGFAQDPCKHIFKNIFAYFFPAEKKNKLMPNANVNIAKFNNQLVALTEVPLPIIFDAKTLKTEGPMHHYDELPESKIHTTAHPHYDPVAKENLGYFTKFGRKSSYNLFSIQDGTTKRKLIAQVEVDKPSYMHSFGITENYAILTALPLVVNPLDLIIMRKAFIKNFKWKPELGTKFIVIDRINDKLVDIFTAEPFFAFHVVNAYEQNKNIIIDIITFPNALGIGEADLIKILEKQLPKQTTQIQSGADADATEAGTLKRFTINLDTKKVTSKILSDEFIELPRINYEKFNGKDYTYVYAYAKSKNLLHEQPYVADKLVKINVKTGQVLSWIEEKCYPGEPVYVAAPDAKSEDDGVILSVVLDINKKASFLLVLDAQNFKELARAYVPHHIPFGIHGFHLKYP